VKGKLLKSAGGVSLITLNTQAHLAAKHPPEESNGRNKKFVDLRTPWFKEGH